MLDDEGLARKRRELQRRSAVLRHELGVQVNEVVAPIAGSVQRVRDAGQWLWQRPWLLAGAAVGLMAWRPRGALKMLGQGWWLWQAWQRVRGQNRLR